MFCGLETEPEIVSLGLPCYLSRFLRPFWLAVFVLLLPAGQLAAQEALRVSLAGDVAAATRKQAQNSVGYYNLMWGPVTLRCSAGLSEEYNDNVLNTSGSSGDLITRPSVQAQINWPVTAWNTLNLSLDAGYSIYATHSELSQLYFNPGSGLSLDVYVGEWVFNLHDRVAMTENTYENPTVAGGQNNTFLQNDAGISGLWDLNKFVVSLGYDHENYMNLSSSLVQPDSAAENFYINVGTRLRPQIMVGLEAGLGLVNYDQASGTNSNVAPVSDAVQWNAGLFTSVQLSEHLSARLDGGYTVYTPDTVQTNLSSGLSAFYFQFSLSHQITEHIGYSLSAGRSVDFAYDGQAYDRLFVRLNPNWNVLRKWSVGTPVWWEQGTQVGRGSLTYDQYGAGFTIGRMLTQKLSAQFHYQWVMEISDQASYNYTANIVGLNFTYQF
jgi:hypothetical protein